MCHWKYGEARERGGGWRENRPGPRPNDLRGCPGVDTTVCCACPPDDGHAGEAEEMVRGGWDCFNVVFPAKIWSLPNTWSFSEKSPGPPLGGSEQRTGLSQLHSQPALWGGAGQTPTLDRVHPCLMAHGPQQRHISVTSRRRRPRLSQPGACPESLLPDSAATLSAPN